MKKRIGSLLLILALCFTLLPTAAFAADSADAWDGTADISWYTDHETDTEYRFTTAEQLAGMAKLINDDMANFKDKTIYLENDLDLGGHEWISIGDGANTDVGSFQGVFDGQSHVIYNLYSHEGLKSENKDNNNNLYRNGLFGAIYNATVQNLGIENADMYSNYSDVTAAIEAVDRNKSKAEQSEVDAMAQAIEAAIAALEYKAADYSKVDAAIAKANALNKDEYKDFTAVEAAVNAVVRDKNITEQSKVDAMAKAIEEAINALVRKSSGGDDSDPTYAIKVGKDIRNGTVTANRRYAERGDTVTITVKPDDGFKLDDLTVTDKNGKELKLTDKGNGKYTFTMPAGKVEINAAFDKEVEISPFSDVSTSAYYYEAVKWAQEKGITGGIGNGLFGPNQPCTRAQIVTFLWRAAGSPEPKAMSSFADVSTDAYYAKAVAWAVENGITTGMGDGKFSPDATCTRAQSVTFLFRAIGKLVDSKAEFSDVLTDSYYANAVAWAVENGVTNGIGDGLFGPNNSCTRAQIVTFLYRAYQGQ